MIYIKYTGWCGRASCHQRLAPIPIVDNWLKAIFPLMVELNLVKCRQRFDCLPWGKCLTLASVEESIVFKIKDDDDYLY